MSAGWDAPNKVRGQASNEQGRSRLTLLASYKYYGGDVSFPHKHSRTICVLILSPHSFLLHFPHPPPSTHTLLKACFHNPQALSTLLHRIPSSFFPSSIPASNKVSGMPYPVFVQPTSIIMNDSAIPTTSSPVVTPRRLVRQQTPLPSRYESSSDEDIALKIQTASNTAMNRNMLGVNRTLFWNLASQQDHYSESESDSDSDSDSDNDNSSGSDDDSSTSEEEDEEDEAVSQETSPENEDDNDGRERDSSIMDLSSGSTFSFSWPTTACSLEMSSPSLAMQADKKTKRIRIDPSAVVSGKKVRFDESRNKVHLHYRQSTISPPGTPAKEVCSPSARPLKSALAKRLDQTSSFDSSLSPSPFQLSLDNTSQEVMDFASSLTRLMGGASASGSQEQFLSPPSMSQLSVGSPIPGSSPLRSFAMFKHAPPSPVRPPFMSASYSPPRTSSLSSCWSPTLSEDEGSNENEGASAGNITESRPLSPSRPTLVQGRTTVRFTPRRPRHQTPSPSSSGTTPGSPKPRFPAMLKREASNASFLDNYPSSLTPESALTSTSPSMSPRDECSTLPATVIAQNGETMDHAAIAAAVLNMASSPDNHA